MKTAFIVTALAGLAAAGWGQPAKTCRAIKDVKGVSPPANNNNGGSKNTDGGNKDNNNVYAATCPADNGKTVAAGGSCGASFTIHCDVSATPGASSKFWEQTSGQLVGTLAECNKQCDDNALCEATLWVDDASSKDYHHCWQTSGLGPVTGAGKARISYKGQATGKCSASYSQKG
ncbi:uncharacterized protein HMPREF1541_01522 [Cyphellophora europaea CBS 101466]|uniref:Apple domain-containing protein n=1 Tax=Cyphellophora europaea (strain CBS 101466) TaxID=1220924 RepID=W2S2X2_CYPE1|nr:uncharacterized protein HMPREF1541_01522 [Cyphellophora europaea CBS 101466]ETN42368.1 hypothetical protein HMPREF1541_01522 [Cyphellophora europaea CBS 101466]